MPSADGVGSAADGPFATFTEVRVDESRRTPLVDRLAHTWRRDLDDDPGLISARVHVVLERPVVVHHALWRSEVDRDRAVSEGRCSAHRALIDAHATVPVHDFGGIEHEPMTGPAAGRPPGIVAVATRHFAGRQAARAVLGLFYRSSEWKQACTGFVRATPYLNRAGTEFVNYPQWVDRSAYDRWMADPRISAGQEEVARHETRPPQYLLCTVADDMVPTPTDPAPVT